MQQLPRLLGLAGATVELGRKRRCPRTFSRKSVHHAGAADVHALGARVEDARSTPPGGAAHQSTSSLKRKNRGSNDPTASYASPQEEAGAHHPVDLAQLSWSNPAP